MPSKNIIKEYKENTYYHIYNRGVDKRIIFSDTSDYKKFLSYLKLYLTPISLQGQTLKVSPSRALKNYADNVSLLAYCLMPNHFHLLIHQTDPLTIAEFMQSLCTKYSFYFNRKNSRTGPLFQSRYRAVEISSENQFIYLSKYIHLNISIAIPLMFYLQGQTLKVTNIPAMGTICKNSASLGLKLMIFSVILKLTLIKNLLKKPKIKMS